MAFSDNELPVPRSVTPMGNVTKYLQNLIIRMKCFSKREGKRNGINF